MAPTKPHWTQAHDLALVFLALAYGADEDLTDDELATITDKLGEWRADFPADEVQDVVMEALAIYLEDEGDLEVVQAIDSLKVQLTPHERCRALEDVVSIAEADGVFLTTEQDLIATLAQAWEIRAVGERLIDQSTVPMAEAASWSLLHDMALMYLVVAHSADNEINDAEISAMIKRLQDWQPELKEDEIRAVLRQALGLYSQGIEKDTLQRTVQAIRDNLPVVHRLVLLDDLAYIARVDAPVSEMEEEILTNLSQAWGVGVRLNGRSD